MPSLKLILKFVCLNLALPIDNIGDPSGLEIDLEKGQFRQTLHESQLSFLDPKRFKIW